MFNNNILGKRIRSVRGKKSQDVFAAEIGISRGALSFYENGDRTPDAEIIYKICKCGNVSADYLLGFTDNQTTDTNLKAVCKYTGLSEETIENIKNHCFIPKEVETRDYEKPLSVQYFTPDYYKTNKYIVNNILSNYSFWNIVFHLCSLMCFSNELQTKFPDINQLITQCIDRDGFTLNQQLEEYYNKCNGADVCRYSIMKEIEKISDLFDNRVKKEASYNGEHNPPEE